MELWLVLGILAYVSFAISTSLDKYMMNVKCDIIQTSTFKMFFDGLILLIVGIAFFNLAISQDLILWALILGVLYAIGNIIYYKLLKIKDVEEAVPASQSLEILLIFIFSIILFSELVTISNYIGVALILIGVYAVLSKTGLSIPEFNKGFVAILSVVAVNITYWLLVKKILFDVKPIDLAIVMYFSTTIILVIYQLIAKKNIIKDVLKFKSHMPTVIVAAFFGAFGTLLIYSALAIGNASRVYPIAGVQSVFIFIIASMFLKEKFYWHRLAGVIAVVFGIFLVSI